MQIIYYEDELPNEIEYSLFLAGPSSRTLDTPSWRPEALRILREIGYNGVVFVPEFRDASNKPSNYEDLPDWEHAAMNMSDGIVFWVPRDPEKLPGFTTNIEFGYQARSSKVVLGAPPEAYKVRYLQWLAKKHQIPCYDNLRDTLVGACSLLGQPALRMSGERNIPLMIWHRPEFQQWLTSHKQVGNRLDGATVNFVHRVGPQKNKPFLWVVHANMFVASENRNKTNELLLTRWDIATAILYHHPQPPTTESYLNTEVVMVREFRVPANTEDAMIHELPGGSAHDGSDNYAQIVQAEIAEETGLTIEASRLRYIGSRQLAGTLSSHKAHVFTAELDYGEIRELKQDRGPRGADLDNPTGERTYVEIKTLRELLEQKNCPTDWSTLGMLLTVLVP